MVSSNFNIRRFLLEFSQSFKRTHPSHLILALGHRCCAKDPTGILGRCIQETMIIPEHEGFTKVSFIRWLQCQWFKICWWKSPMEMRICLRNRQSLRSASEVVMMVFVFFVKWKTGSPWRLSISGFDRKADLKTIKTGCWKKVCSLQRCTSSTAQGGGGSFRIGNL